MKRGKRDGGRPVLAIDIGTSSTRTALFDERAQRIDRATTQCEYALHTDKQGKAEVDPGALLHALATCLRGTMRDSGPVRAVGISCFGHSLIGTDAQGRPLTPVYTWADSRAREHAARWRKRIDQRAMHARTGCMAHASFWPAKLQWLRDDNPRLFNQVRHWMTPADWLVLNLTGLKPEDSRCAHGMATSTGLYNPARLDWDDGVLRLCHVRRDQLMAVDDAPLAPSAATARRFPHLRNALIFPAIMDGVASNLGAGATKPGFAAINFGTSAAVRIMRESGAPRAPFGLFCYRVDSATASTRSVS
jgi:gluconokinase